MKISNWCILFSVLFCGMILYTDLRFRYTMEAQYTMEEYNRIFDRAAEDALTDQLQEEYWDGSLKIDEEKVQNRFFEQTAYVLDLTGETEKEIAARIECVSLTPNNGIITTHQTCLIGNDNLIANIDKFFNRSHFLDSFFARTVLVIS